MRSFALCCLVLIALTVLVSACQFAAQRSPLLQVPSATMAPSSTITATVVATPTPTADLATLLRNNPMPPADPEALARSMFRVNQHDDAEPLMERALVGDSRHFWLADVDQVSYRAITATLLVAMDHVQMWAEDGTDVDQEALARSARTFNDTIYPKVREAFGSEWTPGIDGDPRLVVLNGTFSGAAGYFASANELSRLANPYSNRAEMFVMNLAAMEPGTDRYDSTLAHELEHMIHFFQDRNEAAWVNEGGAGLAQELAGYEPSQSHIAAYASNPDTQLTTWSDGGDVGRHYGASYLFLRYLRERMGQDAVRELIAEPGDGLQGLDAVLSRMSGPTGDELLADWFVANVVAHSDDPRYALGGLAPDISVASVGALPAHFDTTVSQHGVDYYQLESGARQSISIEGETIVHLLDNRPAGGRTMWWSNRGDSGHSLLRREIDLIGITTATLCYDVWHDIEPGWDYAHLRVSTDGGISWRLLHAPQMTDYNPVGNALGWGYTGASGSPPDAYGQKPVWSREEIDLGDYAGQVTLISLDYFTDDAVDYPGLCVDNWAVDAIGWRDDAEDADPGWESRGFIRHDNRLAQRYCVRLIEIDGEDVAVRDLDLGSDGHGVWQIETAPEPARTILLIAGMTRGTTLPASYSLRIQDLAQP